MTVATKIATPDFLPNLLDWPISRLDRTFRAYVVEPAKYDPKVHPDLFQKALSAFVAAPPDPLDQFTNVSDVKSPEYFDLLTFPEAFISPDVLSNVLEGLGSIERLGCVHVGLRPTQQDTNHLFLKTEILTFITTLRSIPGIVQADLNEFEAWAKQQASTSRFNLGCLFALDDNHNVRICLHPKLVQSKFEFQPSPEHIMEEANLLTVVTLRPANREHKTVVIQPLLCSDALDLATKRGTRAPLEAMQRDADCLGKTPPDHIDVVSVATCTPQIPGPSKLTPRFRTWHADFREAFLRSASKDSHSRHHFAVFILSNFLLGPGNSPGGLSGIFFPSQPSPYPFPDGITLSCYGRPKTGAENNWSQPDVDFIGDKWEVRGFIAALDPMSAAPDTVGRMFGFTLNRLLRDRSSWAAHSGVGACTIRSWP
ncbi:MULTISPECIES: hypothetical protein [unclassified Bradyrhizobium]|uniref:hypothetical protein n=1 Tax=unclassified Bradyrhizobium TaxID=2631580 RepID=UPI0029160CE3|nr:MULTISPECIES: hypothetical protein [unclassified Bradyrhizobium]